MPFDSTMESNLNALFSVPNFLAWISICTTTFYTFIAACFNWCFRANNLKRAFYFERGFIAVIKQWVSADMPAGKQLFWNAAGWVDESFDHSCYFESRRHGFQAGSS